VRANWLAAWTRRCLLAGFAGVAMAAAGASVASAATSTKPPIPEGSALWFACTEQSFTGPLSLRCPLAYDPRYLQTFLAGFSRFTPENEFKMVYLEPAENRFNFTLADQIAEFARANDKTIRGHTLIWNQMLPWWLAHPLFPWNRNDLTATMHAYITTVVSHFHTLFPGTVTEWDVVNEPLTTTGALTWSPWEHIIGPSYIALALEDAHAADPTARLLINDNDADLPGPKSAALLALATNLKESGVPLTGVGFEAHVTPDTAPTLDQLVSLWRQYWAVGLDVEVTELDVADNDGVDDPAAKEAVFERYAQACRMVGNCVGLSVWGVADSYSWLGPDTNALLYNSAFQPTPAATLVHRILSGLPLVTAPPRRNRKAGSAKSRGVTVKASTHARH
jgi:endo-1,4-beta-xylanase